MMDDKIFTVAENENIAKDIYRAVLVGDPDLIVNINE